LGFGIMSWYKNKKLFCFLFFIFLYSYMCLLFIVLIYVFIKHIAVRVFVGPR
jgi:hypothetical protein